MCNIFRAASVWIRVALVCFALGLLLFIIGFSTYAWMSSGNDHSCGLWEFHYCDHRRSQCITHTYGRTNSYHEAIQAMECLGLIGYLLAILFILLYIFANSCRRRDILQAVTALAFAGVIFASIGFAIIGSTTNVENLCGYGRRVGWSMGLAIAGTILYCLGGIMLVIQLIR